MTLIDARCTVCGQEEGTFPSMREAERVLRAHGWLRVHRDRDWYCPRCAWTKAAPFARTLAQPIAICWCWPCRRRRLRQWEEQA